MAKAALRLKQLLITFWPTMHLKFPVLTHNLNILTPMVKLIRGLLLEVNQTLSAYTNRLMLQDKDQTFHAETKEG